MLTRRIWGPVGASDDLQARYGSDPVTISAVARGGDRVDASDEMAAQTKGPAMDLSACFSMLSMRRYIGLLSGLQRNAHGPRLCLLGVAVRGCG